MKRVALPLAVLSVLACYDVTTPATLETPDFARSQADRHIPDHYIVVLNESVDRLPAVASDMARQHAGTVLLTYGTALRGFSMRMSAQAAARLARDQRVAYIEQDQVVSLRVPQRPVALAKPDKPGGGKKGGGGGGDACASEPDYEGHSGLWGIAQVNGGVNGSGRTVWVIDTGIDSDHCDLTVGTQGADFTGSRKGWEDQHGHGTHVAGTIAAKSNGFGVIGVAAGATVEAVRVLDRRGSGRWSWVIAGIDFVAANAAAGDVANMSLGGPASQAVDEAVRAAADAGVQFAVAAGNESEHADNHSPARVNHTNVFTVSAFDSGGWFASFSNYGNPPVDWSAPGVNVASTYKDNGYAMMSGTSMASPHVAGLLALGTFGSCGDVSGDPDGSPDQRACR
jgi:subtilisin family serine protease